MSKTFRKLSVFEKTYDFRKAVKIVEVPLEPPKDDQVLIKNYYAGVNATDVNQTAARYGTDGKVPFDIGLEGLGVIEAVGKDVTTLKVGQPVVFLGLSPKAYAEYIYAKTTEVIPVPALKPEFISLLVCGLTAAIGLDEQGRVKAGDKVLITASAGGTGHIAVQWAKKRGAHVIGMTSSEEKAKLLKDLGADRVINYRTENLDEVLAKEYPDGIDVVWETIGGKVYETLFKHLAAKGRLVVVGRITTYKQDTFEDVVIPNLPTQLLMKNQSITGFFLTGWVSLFPKYLKELIEDVVSGRLRIVLDMGEKAADGPFIGIESVVRGVEHLHSGRNNGKVAIKICKDIKNNKML